MDTFAFGQAITWDDDDAVWRLSDTGEKLRDGLKRRRCPKCNKRQTADGHDPCIANLPGVRFACCGHGVDQGYIMFDDGRVIRGEFELERRIRRGQ